MPVTSSSSFTTIRRLCRSLVPRKLWAKLRSVWCEHKVRRVEKICLREMAATALLPEKPALVFRAAQGTPLRRMLLIANVMW